MALGTRILIADDHHIVRRGLRNLIETHPGWCVVAEAGDGYRAVSEAVRTAPSVAILDCALSGMNGLEAACRIRQRMPRTEVCFFTDCREDAIIQRGLDTGARAYVLKSDPEDDLLAAIESLSRRQPFFSDVVPESLVELYTRDAGRPSRPELLTPREREVVQLVAEGRSNKLIGRTLNLSIKTVETHRGAAMRKAGLSSTAELVLYAVRNHMVEP